MGKYTSEANSANNILNTAISKLGDVKSGLNNSYNSLDSSMDILASSAQEEIKKQIVATEALIGNIETLKGSIMSKAQEIDARIERERQAALAAAEARKRQMRLAEQAKTEGITYE